MKRFFIVVVTAALVVGLGDVFRALGDVPVQPQFFSTAAASGTIGPYSCIGASNATITITSGGSSTLTVKGSADMVVNGTYVTNTTFGTNGVITSPGSNTLWPGNTANFPLGLEITFTGNAGTLSGSVTCTGANGQTVIGAVTLNTPVPVTQASQPWNVITAPPPSPCPTNATDLGCNVHLSGGLATAPAAFPSAMLADTVTGSGGVLVPTVQVACNNSFNWSTTGPGTITAVASAAGIAIYVCGWTFSGAGGTLSIGSSSSANCGGQTALFSSVAGNSSTDSSNRWRGFGGPKPLLGLELCLQMGTGTTGSTGIIYFATASPGP